jgi:hypothetical protein
MILDYSPIDGLYTLSAQEIIKAGSIFFFSRGSYSDYRVNGVFRALRDIDPDAEVARFGTHNGRFAINGENMLAALMLEGAIEEVPHTEWWID